MPFYCSLQYIGSSRLRLDYQAYECLRFFLLHQCYRKIHGRDCMKTEIETLKVAINEKKGGSRRWQMLGIAAVEGLYLF
jgi:hypothetical protein